LSPWRGLSALHARSNVFSLVEWTVPDRRTNTWDWCVIEANSVTETWRWPLHARRVDGFRQEDKPLGLVCIAITTQQPQALVTLAGSVRSTCAEQSIFPRSVDGSRQEDKRLGLVRGCGSGIV